MKSFIVSVLMFSSLALAQDPTSYLAQFDAKVYSLKTKGVKDFVVDIESSKLTKQMNDQMIFGKVDNVTFRLFWTANPERLAIDVLGLPEGFREIKEELKLSMISQLENLLPLPTVQKFNGYKFSAGAKPKEFVAKDTSGIAAIPSFVVRFDDQDRMVEVEGEKPVGTLVIQPSYSKESFSDGKWVLKKQVTKVSENGQSVTTKKDMEYGTSQGIGVLTEVTVTTEQKAENKNAKSLNLQETIEFKNYKINTGEGMKYFLGEQAKPAP